jgi:hypothetical protein
MARGWRAYCDLQGFCGETRLGEPGVSLRAGADVRTQVRERDGEICRQA